MTVGTTIGGRQGFPATPSVSLIAAKQGLFRVLCGQRLNVICQLHTALPATYEANVAQVSALIRLKRLDFRLVVRSYHLVPV